MLGHFLSNARRHAGLFLALIAVAMVRAEPAADADGRALLQGAWRTIAAYHAGSRNAKNVLRVVYFCPADRDPLPDYADRLDRVMSDISDFYRQGLCRFGLENDGLPLERKDGHLVLHLVRGKKAAADYTYDSGNETEEEVRAALKAEIDFDHEHVLVLYALCRRDADGRYIFNAPYYGRERGSSQRDGFCHAADGELLDPRFLTETGKKIVYTEHYHARLEQTWAKFNSWYIGGVAHELGHGLGLGHDAGSPPEQRFGVSLMGVGNQFYRAEKWGDSATAYLSRATALQLASHPLFTQSNRGRWDEMGESLDDLVFSIRGHALQIEGRTGGKLPAYAVVAYASPVASETDHDAISFPALVTEGRFVLQLDGLRPDTYYLRVETLHVNGGVVSHRFRLEFDASGMPRVAALNSAWMEAVIDRAEKAVMDRAPEAGLLLTDDQIARARAPEAQRKLRILRETISPTPPVDLALVSSQQVFLSDVTWREATVGWGQVARNHYWFDDRIHDGVFLTLGGTVYEKGLYAHSSSHYRFDLNGRWRTLTAIIGLRDGANPQQGSAVFTVRGDGRELYRSPILRPGSRQEIRVDIANVQTLELFADGGEGHNFNSWAIWAEPVLSR